MTMTDHNEPNDASALAISEDSQEFEDIIEQGSEAALEVDSAWIYKVDDQVFGPVTSRELLEKLYAGEVDAETSITPEDEGDFMALRRYGAFRAHLPKVEKHLAEVAAAERKVAEEKKKRVKSRLGLLVVVGVLAAVVFSGTLWVIRNQRAERIAQERESELRGQLKDLLASVTIEPPLAGLPSDEPEPEASKQGTSRRAKHRKKRRRRVKFTGTGELSNAEIMQGVGSVFGGLKNCIVKQIHREADSVPEQVVLVFAVGNNGRAKDVTLDDRILRTSPMRGCFAGQMAQVRFRPFKGEVRNVEYPISVARR